MNVRRTRLALLNWRNPNFSECFKGVVVPQERKRKKHRCAGTLQRGIFIEQLCVQAACDCHSDTVDVKTSYGNISARRCMRLLYHVQYINSCERLVKDWPALLREMSAKVICVLFDLTMCFGHLFVDRCIDIFEEIFVYFLVFNCERARLLFCLISYKQGHKDYFNSDEICYTQ